MAFKLKSQAAVSEGGFKMMGSSPLTMAGHEPELPRGHIHPGGDDKKWEVKDEIKNADGSITIETRSGRTGSEGTPGRTETITKPGKTTVVTGKDDPYEGPKMDPDEWAAKYEAASRGEGDPSMIKYFENFTIDGKAKPKVVEEAPTTEVIDIPAEDPVEATEETVDLTMNPEQHWREVKTKHGNIRQKRPILDFFQNLKGKFGKGRTSGGDSCGPNDKGPDCASYD